jgi:hypothetical protein
MIVACSYLYRRFSLCVINRVTKKSVHQKYSLVLTGMLRFDAASEFVERYHSVVNWALSVEALISNNFCEFYNTEISNVF